MKINISHGILCTGYIILANICEKARREEENLFCVREAMTVYIDTFIEEIC
jgi:ectoine hydroxylase-related dioxygenase (phytanoyl-CoA dioxygenase family)